MKKTMKALALAVGFALRAGADCYFVVYQVDVNNRMQIIYSNPYNKLKAGLERAIPKRFRPVPLLPATPLDRKQAKRGVPGYSG
jgi:hypothetical protein